MLKFLRLQLATITNPWTDAEVGATRWEEQRRTVDAVKEDHSVCRFASFNLKHGRRARVGGGGGRRVREQKNVTRVSCFLSNRDLLIVKLQPRAPCYMGQSDFRNRGLFSR